MNRFGQSACVLLFALLLVGCQSKSTNSSSVEEMVPVGPQYSAKKGLLVPEETQRSVGLKLVEVTEQKLVTTVEIQLRVYEITRGAILASASVTPAQAKQLGVGSSVTVRLRDGRSVSGKITRLDGQLQKTTGAVEVLVAIPNGAAELAVGSFAPASVAIESAANVITIPRAALIQCSDGYSVYTVSGEHFIRTPVKVGAINQELVEIKDGLYTGDQVVLQPVMSLWMTELAAVKGGQACCVVPAPGK